MAKSKGNTSSFHIVKDGRMIHGNAAFLHIASQVGGVDGFLDKYGQEIMRDSLSRVLVDARQNAAKPKLVS